MPTEPTDAIRRILVVDDNPAIHDDFRKVLSPVAGSELGDDLRFLFDEPEQDADVQLNYEIDFATQGRDALEMAAQAVAKEQPYAAMFVDMRMPPGWDGLTTIERIWQTSPDTQAVICTAYSDYTWQEIVQRLGVSDRLLLIQKPFSHIEVQQAAATLTTKWNQNLTVRAHLLALETNLERLRTEMARREAAEHRALHDALTDLPNRTHFIERLRVAIRHAAEGARIGLAAVDVDRFRPLVEGLGHAVSDMALAQVAERLQRAVRAGDLLARTGPDQFTLLAMGVADTADLIERVRALQTTIREPIEIEDHRLRLTASAGVTWVDAQAVQPSVLLHQADAALNRARDDGGDSLRVFEAGMLEASSSWLQLLEDLQIAVEQGDIDVFYQPIVDLETGRVSGFEALGRWRHPQRGWISPATFVPIAEDTRLIIPLGQHVLETACKARDAFEATLGRKVSMSVNVSAVQLTESDLVSTFREVLEHVSGHGCDVKLELTESAIMRDPESATRLLEELRALSAHIYVDDFGTGFSSLSYLKRLPVDALKIDCSFTSHMHEHDDDLAIVQTILALGRALGLLVVAEGVETQAQLDLLRKMGCDLAQGYFFSRAISREDALVLLAKDPTW